MDATTIEALIARLGHENPRWRAEAEAALKRRGAEAVPALIAALGDPAVAVRVHAAHVLGRLRAASAADALVKLLSDPEANSAAAIAAERALIDIGDSDALVKALEGPAAPRALRALGAIAPRKVSVIQAVRSRLTSAHGPTRTQAAVALLGLLGDVAIEEVAPLLSDSDKWVRYGVAEALAPLGVRRTAAVLNEAMNEEEDAAYMRGWAEALLSELQDCERSGRGRH